MTPTPPTASASSGSWSEEEIERAARAQDECFVHGFESWQLFDQHNENPDWLRWRAGKIRAMRAALQTLSPQGSWQPISTARLQVLLPELDDWCHRVHKAYGRLQSLTLTMAQLGNLDSLLYYLSGLIDPDFDPEEAADIRESLDARTAIAAEPNPPLGPEEE